MKKQIIQPYSQLEFINGRRWEKAFFTSYALSLTFFETYLLPSLRKAGCEEITILVDLDGYRSSLMEQKSRHVGQEYSLIPVQSKQGIFHPKITYLSGSDTDLLMVGSGNITFGGNGKNIEVLEVLSPENDSDTFKDFALFLDDLISSDKVYIPNIETVKKLKNRAEKAGLEFASKGETRLIHSLQTSVVEQLTTLAKVTKGWDELLVLSPFHHPMGTPVLKLAEGIGVKKLTVGVSPNSEDETSFPFEEAKKWGLDINVVAPKVEQAQRRLHAKWFELRGTQAWSLTGSVNATAQSLTTTKNVEVAILRILDKPSTEHWKAAKKPNFKADSFIETEKISSLSIYAELDANGHIQGQILGKVAFDGEWDAYIDKGDELIENTKIIVNNQGNFVWPLIDFSEFQNASALQIRLIKDDCTARGWVSIQSILKLSSRSRVAINALSRMLSRSESTEDISALIDYIALHVGKVAAINTHFGSGTSLTRTVIEDFSFSIDDLSLSTASSETDLFRDLASSDNDDKSWYVLQTIAKLLLGKKITPKKVPGTRLKPPISPVIDSDEDAKALEHTKSAISAFNDEVRDAYKLTQAGDGKLAQLLFVWLSVNLDMCLRRLNDRHAAFLIVEEWMQKISKSLVPAEARPLLDDAVFGIAASLAWYVNENLSVGKSFYGITLNKSLIHQWLESYTGDALDIELSLLKAQSWFTHEIALMLVEDKAEDAINQLKLAIEQPTARGVLSSIIEAVGENEPVVIPSGIFNLEEESIVQKIIKSTIGKAVYRSVNHHNLSGCPKCYVKLAKDIKARLSTRRITECIECKIILISLEP